MNSNYDYLNESDIKFIKNNKLTDLNNFKITKQQINELEKSESIPITNAIKVFRLVSTDFLLESLVSSSKYVVHRAVKTQLINNLQLTASTKTRSEVRGGGKKPWKQKGTGNARAGSSRSPLWRGGGVAFGPKPKKQYLKINKKEKSLALKNSFINKKEKWLLLENLGDILNESKTRLLNSFLNEIRRSSEKKFLLILENENELIKKATRNLKNVDIRYVSNIDVVSVLKADVIITSLDILKNSKFEGVFK
uniref:Large ribosomal subunit protein uL4c n=1 Tax=Olisthodiscus luteus TaxID=83000 RepID=A0A7U0KT78_OLILU|nr:ribosomal protein L4 [Olisthodiscus luteus]QQW50595.1 ribosomal protein L4 [Olisthodiscus luteus]